MKRLAAAAALVLSAVSCGPRRDEPIVPAEPGPIAGSAARPAAPPPLVIQELFPRVAESGIFFDLDFDGSSAIYVAGEGFTPRSVVHFDGRPVATEYQMRRRLIARIPPSLLARPRTVAVEVRDPGPPSRQSAAAEFRILPPRAAGACPRAESLSPPSAKAGVPFVQQPDGSSAIRVAGEDFGPRSTVRFGETAVKTVYHGPAALVALVPPDLLKEARTVSVSVTDPDCRRPAASRLEFRILP